MKKINIFAKLTVLIFSMICMLCISVSAADFILTDDYEKYDADYELPKSKYHSATRNTMVVNRNDSKVAKLLSNGRVLFDMPKNPDNKLIISYDFMLDNAQASGIELFGVQESTGNIHAVHVIASGGKVYATNDGRAVIDSITAGKWYNIQAIIDLQNKCFDLRSGSNVVEDIDFKTEIDDIKRVFSIMVTGSDSVYVDNVEIAEYTDDEIDDAIYLAKSLWTSADTGYENGKYPASAVEMLKDVYTSVYEQFKVGAATTDHIAQLNDAIAVFNNSRIDSSSTDTAANHIKVATDDRLLIDNGGMLYDLNEKLQICDKAGNPVAEELIITTESTVEGVTITNGVIDIPYGSSGYLKLKAQTASGIYTTFTIRIVSYGSGTITECIAYDTKIIVRGMLDKKNEYDVTARFDRNKPTRFQNNNLFIADDNTFEFEVELNPIKTSQQFVIKIYSDDIKEITGTYQYYGDGWRDVAIAEFNAAENDATATGIKALLEKYNFELNISKTLWDTYSDAIISYVYKSKSFADYDALKTAIREIEYIIAHKDASRENIEEILADNMDMLVANGFNKAAFDSLTATNKTQFYLNALDVAIDLQTTTVAGVCTQLNEMVDALKTPAVRPNRPVTGGSSGGSGGGGGGSSYVPKYEISPVATEKPVTVEPETEKEELPETEPFADIADAEWAKDALMYMKAKDIMVGYNNEVRPNDSVTRGECAKILVVAFGLELEGEGRTFADSADAWWAPYASIASTNNVVNGYEDGSFGGDDIITREMLATMIDRIITAKGIELYDKNTDSSFADNEEISDYAAEAVAKLYKKGIINGVGNNLFAPKLAVTRAEAAKMVYSVLTEK